MNKKKDTEPSRELINYTLSLFDKKDLNKLETTLQKMVDTYPAGSTSWLFLGMFYNLINDIKKSETALLKALSISPKYAEAIRLYADILRKKGNIDDSIKYAREAVQIAPNNAAVYDTLGTSYAVNNNYTAAYSMFVKAIELNNNIASYNNLGNALRNLGRFDESIETLKQAIKLNPNIIEIYINLSLSYFENYNYEEAIAVLDNIKSFNIDKTNQSSIFSAYGHIYRKLHRSRLAKDYYLKSESNKGEFIIGVLEGLADIYSSNNQHHKSLEYFKKAMSYPLAKNRSLSNYIMTYAYFDESHKDKKFNEINKYADQIKPLNKIKQREFNKLNKKIRVGFISGDLHEHPVSYFLNDMMEKFNDGMFESYAYYNHYKNDKMTKKLREKFSEFKYINNLNDIEKFNLINNDMIDVLIDLSGHTSRNCLSVLRSRAAPIQMTWLGFSDTTGIKEIDYILCDKISIPENEEKWFTEKPLRLKNSFYCFSNPGEKNYKIENKNNEAIVYGCFSNIKKFNDDVINCWSKILQKKKNSKLLLKSEFYRDKDIKANLIDQFTDKGVNEKKLIFENDSLRENYLLDYNRVDVILDTYPYPGGTTTCESLFMGTPVISMKGSSFLSRNSENILSNAGFFEFIAQNEEDYINKAIEIKEILKNINLDKKEIRKKFIKSKIMDKNEFCFDFKKKIQEAWLQYNIEN